MELENRLFSLLTKVCDRLKGLFASLMPRIRFFLLYSALTGSVSYSGSEDLNSRWLCERAVKEAGYPEHVVRSVLFPVPESETVTPSIMDWAALLTSLGQRLVGDDLIREVLESDFDVEERDMQRILEFSALESVYPSATCVNDSLQASKSSTVVPESVTTYFNIPIPNSPLTLHMVLPAWHPYPLSASSPPMYISSNRFPESGPKSSTFTVPPYIRLHILSSILRSNVVKNRDQGEGIALVATGIIEEEWENIQTQGPPEVADVLRHIFRPSISDSFLDPGIAIDNGQRPVSDKLQQRQDAGHSVRNGDDRIDARIRADFESIKRTEQYQSLFKERAKLPAWKAKAELLQAFKTNRVVVCVGETGSGKTTQVPQYILDDYLAMSEGAESPPLARLQIIVTQPRRVAAISIASRVSAERSDDGSVAYTIRGESNATRRTKLLFCTTGVVLRRLTVGDGLDGVRVIVVDEVRIPAAHKGLPQPRGHPLHRSTNDQSTAIFYF